MAGEKFNFNSSLFLLRVDQDEILNWEYQLASSFVVLSVTERQRNMTQYYHHNCRK